MRPFLSGTSFRVSDSGFPTPDSFEQILNEIPRVNSFPLFIPTLNFNFHYLIMRGGGSTETVDYTMDQV